MCIILFYVYIYLLRATEKKIPTTTATTTINKSQEISQRTLTCCDDVYDGDSVDSSGDDTKDAK